MPTLSRLALAAALSLTAPAAFAEGGAGHVGQMGAHMHGGPHTRLTDARPAAADDLERAGALLRKLREAIAKYRDHEVALRDGFEPFLPTVPQEIYHFVHYGATAAEYRGAFDATRPGSLLYRRDGDGFELVGAMYSAPAHLSPDDLDRRIPLGVARWHAHVNVCLPEGIELGDLTRGEIGASGAHVAGMLPAEGGGFAARANRRYGFMADGRFGFEGRIADDAGCRAAGGHFVPQAWGWMVHAYPFAGDDPAVAFGLDAPP